MTVNKPAMRLWVEDLRTTDAPQAVGQLRVDHKISPPAFCCLGRACEVAIGSGDVSLVWDAEVGGYSGPSDELESQNPQRMYYSALPHVVAHWFGVDSLDPIISDTLSVREADGEESLSAAGANDGLQWTFHQIADAIESYYELLED